MLTVGSLCTGYGGIEIALDSLIGGQLAFTADIGSGSRKVLAHRYPDVLNLGDLTKVDWGVVWPVNILTAGFPCQDVSQAGGRSGLRANNRSGVWYQVARAIDALQPQLVIIENVRGLLSADADCDMEPCPWCLGDSGHERPLRACGAVLGDLADLGFDAEWTLVSAADCGAPHRRDRVFILAWPAADTAPADTRGRRPGREGQAERHEPGHYGVPAEDPDGAAGDQRRVSASGQAPRRRPRADARRRGGKGDAIPDAGSVGLEGFGANAGQGTESERQDYVAEGPGGHGPAGSDSAAADAEHNGFTGSAPDGTGGSQEQGERGQRRFAEEPAGNGGERTDWGQYAPAIERWEAVTGRPAPRPAEPTGRDGGMQLSTVFVEWMQGLPDGWVTGVPGMTRTEVLTVLGNGVVPQQCALALELLLPAYHAAREVCAPSRLVV